MTSDLIIENLDVHYGGVRALTNLTVTVRAGTCTTLLGANGAGKTSALRGIGGLIRASGTVTLGGRRLDGKSAARRAGAGLGHVLEGRHVFPGLTVAENIAVARRRAPRETRRDPLELLPELRSHLDRPAGGLSGGQQQMLAIARAIAGGPRAVMLDEPTNGLSPKLVARTIEIIAELRDLGYAVLLVEQRLEVAQELGSDVVVLRHGETAHRGSGTDPALPDLLHSMYLS
ncbi:ABC transporter ATP-binding protein [Nocardia sp. NPDC051750]|uniref:ABC transporter ATP-binding protein n=1 Tax=Nocardia sp. NPDC051750 TaxID=3364325 RepID=UPI0037A2247A